MCQAQHAGKDDAHDHVAHQMMGESEKKNLRKFQEGKNRGLGAFAGEGGRKTGTFEEPQSATLR